MSMVLRKNFQKYTKMKRSFSMPLYLGMSFWKSCLEISKGWLTTYE
jgi:hypothetical protein